MRNYLRFVRLTHTQCVPNVFRILGCVDALNEATVDPSRCELGLRPSPLEGKRVISENKAT